MRDMQHFSDSASGVNGASVNGASANSARVNGASAGSSTAPADRRTAEGEGDVGGGGSNIDGGRSRAPDIPASTCAQIGDAGAVAAAICMHLGGSLSCAVTTRRMHVGVELQVKDSRHSLPSRTPRHTHSRQSPARVTLALMPHPPPPARQGARTRGMTVCDPREFVMPPDRQQVGGARPLGSRWV
jgi:hypothetical protein